MADDQRIVDTVAMQTTAGKIAGRLQTLEGYRTQAQGHLQNLQFNYQAESANQFHSVMEDWNAQFGTITNALGKVQTALGGTATNADHTEDTNKAQANELGGTVQNLTLPI
ncbi:WXG100 family type VII secretion target [Actinomadura sp. DC4]|uniref:WXG100 family type VII secretion target n=1 Tax=Actinomadura sp. DC4 TaxID=3055069 RepID=UPI0025B1DEB5|nr:WXG100 family type VII secretion target [Actinomadura sp. DC4]MDN3354769.1 WXG100 family type VII secretion target [Actinomadura sp. DC4]